MRLRRLFAAFVAITVGFSNVVPVVALAEPYDELEALYSEAEIVNEDVNRLNNEIDELDKSISEHEENIEKKSKELESAKENLSQFVLEDYKSGKLSLIDVLLASKSLEDFISRVEAFCAINDYQCETIDVVENLRREIEEEKLDLENDRRISAEALAEAEARLEELNARIAEAEAYKASLSKDALTSIVQQIAEEQHLDAEVVTQALAIIESGNVVNQPSAVVDSSAQVVSEPSAVSTTEVPVDQIVNVVSGNTESVSQQLQSYSSSVEANPGTSSSDYANKVVQAALSQVGKSYVWGTSNPGVSFDCSGLTMYAYGEAGYDISHYSEDQASYCTKPVSEAEVGDILWKPGHVGIYIGNGQTVEAFNPERGVGIGTADRFVAAGSPASFN